MRRSFRPGVVALGVLAAFALPAAAHAAGPPNLQCNGTYSGGMYANVIVPPNGNCDLSNTTVMGNVTALSGSSLTLDFSSAKSSVGGNVAVGSNVAFALSQGWTVGGTITGQGASILGITGGTTHDILSTGTGDLFVSGATVKGNLVANQTQGFGVIGSNPVITGNVTINASANSVSEFDLESQLVNGNVSVTNNNTQIEIFFNTIRESLACTGNSPAPDDNQGDGNYVQGHQLGQCAGFQNSPGDGVEGG